MSQGGKFAPNIAETGGMDSPMPHVGEVPCRRSAKRHRRYIWGMKKGARRARRQDEVRLIRNAVEDQAGVVKRQTRRV